MPSSRDIRAGGASIALSVKNNLEAGLSKAKAQLQALGSSVRNIGIGVGAAGAAIQAPMLLMRNEFAAAGDDVHKMAGRLGVGTSFIQEMTFAMQQSGEDAGVLERALLNLSKKTVSLNDAFARGRPLLGPTAAAFKDMGINAKAFAQASPEQQLDMMAEGFAQLEDKTKAGAHGFTLAGKAGAKLGNLFSGGAEGIAALRQEARDLNIVMSESDVILGADLTDATNRFNQQMKAIRVSIGSAVADGFIQFQKQIAPIISSVIKWVKENGHLVKIVLMLGFALTVAGGALIALGVTFASIGAIIGTIGTLLSGAITAISALAAGVVALISPFGLLLALIVAGGVALVRYTSVVSVVTSFVKEKFQQILAFAMKVFGGIKDALAAGDIQMAAMILWKALTVIFMSGVVKLREIWEGFRLTAMQTFSGLITGIKTAWVLMTGFIAEKFADAMGAMINMVTPLLDVLEKVAPQLASELKLIAESPELIKQGIKDDTAAKLNAIQSKAAKASVDRATASDKRLKASRDALEKAEKDLDKAIRDAATARADKERKDAEEIVQEKRPQIEEETERKIRAIVGTAGGFSGRAVSRLSLQSVRPIEAKMLSAQDRSADALESILAFQQQGASFG